MTILRLALLPSLPLLVAGLALAALVPAFEERQLDRALEAHARALHHAALASSLPAGADADFFFQAWRRNGEILVRSESLGIAGQLVKMPAHDSRVHCGDVELPGGLSARQAFIDAADLSVAVAAPRADLDARATSLRGFVAAIVLVLIFVAASLARAVEIRAIARLRAETEDALARQRRMASDVAHELRTPVAELRNLAEVGMRWPDDRETVSGFLDDVREIARQMETTIADLEILARSVSGLEGVEPRPVDIAETLDRIWPTIAASARERGLESRLESTPNLVATTDPDKLQLILLNLLTNAVNYSRSGGTIELRCRRDAEHLRLTVTNPPRDLESADLERMFDRFWRKDASRSGQNAGLGLALVRALADLLDILIETRLESGVLSISLLLPASSGKPQVGGLG